jgi:hypothetical protein
VRNGRASGFSQAGPQGPPDIFSSGIAIIKPRVHGERFFAGMARMGSAGFQPDTPVCILHTDSARRMHAGFALEARICGLEARASRKRPALEGRSPVTRDSKDRFEIVDAVAAALDAVPFVLSATE